MKRKSTWELKTYVNGFENTWITLHDQAINITQIDGYDNITEHNIHITSNTQLRTLIILLQAALQEYED